MGVRPVISILCISVIAIGFVAILNARAIGNAFAVVTCSTGVPCAGGNNTSSGVGVRGASYTGIGMFGSSKYNDGVVGRTTNGTAAVMGESTTTAAVLGKASKDGIGVNGTSVDGMAISGTSTNSAGVNGISNQPSTAATNVGAVQGFGNGYNGVYGYSTMRDGGFFENNSTSYYTLYAQADNAAGYPLGVLAESGAYFYVDTGGNGAFSGSVTASGYNTAIRSSDGTQHAAFAPQATRAQIEDTGTAGMVAGRADVRFDAAFARTIDFRSGYQVFLTPGGDTRGLYVALKSPNGFEVRESQGGRSTIAFDYRVVAHPLGASYARLPAIHVKSAREVVKGHVPQ